MAITRGSEEWDIANNRPFVVNPKDVPEIPKPQPKLTPVLLHQARVIIKREQVSAECSELFAFRCTEKYAQLTPIEQNMITEQLNAMELLENILAARLKWWGLL